MPNGLIIKSISGLYYVLDSETEKIYKCRGRGNFRYKKISPLVGDYVDYSQELNDEGYILEIDERKNELVRPPICNVDQAILVFSAKNPKFSPNLLDRFLALIEYNNIKPIIVVSKIDLLTESEKTELDKQIAYYERIGYDVYWTTQTDPSSVDDVLETFKNNITVLAGQSGVGKSSLLNIIDSNLELKTGEISKHLGRGRHTTRHVELHRFNNGFVADTPGFSSLEFIDMELEDLSQSFIDFFELSSDCKYRGCLHINEPKCAVKEALKAGNILQSRYDNYVSFVEEIKNRKPKY